MKSSVAIVALSALGVVLGEVAYHRVLPGATAAPGRGSSPVVEAERFDLVDRGGHRRASLAVTDAGAAGLWFFDTRGKARLNVGVYEDGEGFVVVNDASERAVGILRSVAPTSAPVLVLKSAGRDRMILGLSGKDAEPFMVRDAADGTRTAVFGAY